MALDVRERAEPAVFQLEDPVGMVECRRNADQRHRTPGNGHVTGPYWSCWRAVECGWRFWIFGRRIARGSHSARVYSGITTRRCYGRFKIGTSLALPHW